MNASINRLKIIFMGVFAFAVVAIWTYSLLWLWPEKDCQKAGGEWDGSQRVCATPIYIPDLTGRPAGMSRGDWSRIQAERLLNGKISADHSAPPPAQKKTPQPASKPSQAQPAPVPATK